MSGIPELGASWRLIIRAGPPPYTTTTLAMLGYIWKEWSAWNRKWPWIVHSIESKAITIYKLRYQLSPS